MISTTRYRKDPKVKPTRRAVPALKRQISGSKGGQATRNAQRRAQALREARSVPNLNRQRQSLRHSQRFGPPLQITPVHFQPNGPLRVQHFANMPPTPPSPYFVGGDCTVARMPRSAPLTPPHAHMFDQQPKPAMPDTMFSSMGFTAPDFVTRPADFPLDTPSLGTEASFMS